MSRKTYAVFGVLSVVIFWITYAIMAGLRPEFNLFYKAISELGSIDAPNKWIWNIFGYILPGFLIAVFSLGLFKNIAHGQGSKLPLISFVLSGILMSLSGIFPGDFENRQSATMLMHTLGSFGSYAFFLLGAFTYPKQMQKSEYWKKAVNPTLAFTWLTILFGAWPFTFKSIPAVGQRLVFFFYLMWIFYTALRLYRQTISNGSYPTTQKNR